MSHVHLFVGGLHTSGTSMVARILAEHPQISGFSGTGVPEDEGQHLQSVFPTARVLGGAGRFALDPEAHLTEESPLATAATGRTLFEEWSPHWELDRPVLLEKSPPNLVRSRFLQAIFPRSLFVMVVRHPAAVTLATARRQKVGVEALLAHWLAAHETLVSDAGQVRELHVVRYEHVVLDPQAALAPVLGALGLEPHRISFPVRPDVNDEYFERWRRSRNPLWVRRRRGVTGAFEPLVRRFGYSLHDLDLVDPWPAAESVAVTPPSHGRR